MTKIILLADDSPTIRKVVELTLSDTDARVECARTGREALARLEHLRPDLVLADVVMPEPSGYEICRRVKASARPVPVLLLAGTFEAFDPERAARCGADGHLMKPFESDALRREVWRLLRARVPAPGSAGKQAGARPETAPLSAQDLDALARAVVERLSREVLREVAREVVPAVAERIIRERIRELEREDDAEGT